MSKEVERYTFVCDIENEEYVLASDYEALLAERDRLREALEHCIDSLGSEYALPSECIKQARAALQGAQP
ncbi:MAG: hypothetical protein ACLGIW_08120 [Gammaproteobacteria bacterium]